MICIISHVYARELPQYSVFLRAQMSSLLLHQPDVLTHLVICYSPEDEAVKRILNELGPRFGSHGLTAFPMKEAELFRRSIGRNILALKTEFELTWFCDIDHYFGPGCLDSVWDEWQKIGSHVRGVTKPPAMIYPSLLLIHKTHEIGDAWWEQNIGASGLIKPNFDDFEKKVYNRAIRGVQICHKEFLNQHGYLNWNPKWLRPRSDGRAFGDFQDDVRFRGFCDSHGGTQKIEIKNLYRLRHSKVTYGKNRQTAD